MSNTRIRKYLDTYTSAAPLAVFRIAFGLMICGSILRFWYNGWIEELYVRPAFFFSYYGFGWVKPLGKATYLLFALCGLSALSLALGFRYRLSALLLFLSFTYIEFMDKTTYLNHYYFVSLVCFLLLLLPAHCRFSLDVRQGRIPACNRVPRYTIDALKLMMGIVYFYAGLAKLNSDWLLRAQPLGIWLPAKNDLPVLGYFFNKSWAPYVFSWAGCFYDLCIPFLLLRSSSRPFAYAAVVVFHVLTAILFPIGMFPYVMIVAALIFFPSSFHEPILTKLQAVFRRGGERPVVDFSYTPLLRKFVPRLLLVFFVLQLLFPFRYLLYPGELFWTEEGYRFSWRVMLMEKAGYAVFTVKEPGTGRYQVINNNDFLTRLQEKQMSTQPDMILQYAHLLASVFRQQGWQNPAVYVSAYITLNGRPGKFYIDSQTDLARKQESFKHKDWILPFGDEIGGL